MYVSPHFRNLNFKKSWPERLTYWVAFLHFFSITYIHVVDENVIITTLLFCYLKFRVTIFLANAAKTDKKTTLNIFT